VRANRGLGYGLLALAAVIATIAVLGPFLANVIRYRTSATTLNQIIGGDAAALLVMAPICVIAGVLALRAHPAAPVLALAPACYAVYTYTQLIVGQEYLRLPGNNERFFPLLLGGFLLGGAIAVAAWTAIDPLRLPAPGNGLRRLTVAVLAAVAVFLVGQHLPSLVDALRDTPTVVGYVSSPTPFWLVKLMDLGIVVPLAGATAIGLARGRPWARRSAFAILGAYTLLGASVAGMAITMLINGDPDASAGITAGFILFTLAFAALTGAQYRALARHSVATAG
jgi:hypothetical protein